jgi:site-specific DNA-cytosine methylase
MLNSMSTYMDDCSIRGLRRKVNIVSVCAGVWSEAFAANALGLPLAVGSVCCDIHESSRKFIAANHFDRVSHIFKDMDAIGRTGWCDIHQRICSDPTGVADGIFGGTPCQPFSGQRGNLTSTPPDKHPLFSATFGTGEAEHCGFIEVLRRTLPRGGILEQVHGFSSRLLSDGTTGLARFIKEVKSIVDKDGKFFYTAVQAVRLQPHPFMEGSRPR